MSNLITTWRQNVITYLEGEFTAAKVVGGERKPTVNHDPKDLIVVFWPGWDELRRDIALATPSLTVRYHPSLSKQPPTSEPRDEEPLEQAAVDLMAAFKTKREFGAFADGISCRISRITKNSNPGAWYVEATLAAFALNLANAAA